MVNEYKRIVLLKGLTPISDDHFRLFKSWMSSDLRLERSMQEQYTRVQIADMMEDEFPDAGLNKLIKFCEDLPALRKRADILRKERSKAIGETSLERNSQEAGPARATSTTRHMNTFLLESETGETSTAQAMTSTAQEESATAQTPRRGIVPKKPAKEEGHQKGLKKVMVLKVTETFTYDMKDYKRMFHATVATETEFFRVKVFDIALEIKFFPGKIIAISDYFESKGFLEIYRASSVSSVNDNQTIFISKTLRQRANATPKISYLFSQEKGTFVNGEFVVFKKTERNEFIYYGIQDETGKMEVVVDGHLTNISCEPGSKLRLVCFELTSTEKMRQLRAVSHSYMEVINARI